MAKSTKRNGLQLLAFAAALCLSATSAVAAGLGKITVLSPLGQPLQAEIDLNATREELVSMNARVASPEAFRQLGIEYVPRLGSILISVDKRKDGRPYLRMYSDRPIDEPFLSILVELTWSSGRVVREYTVLLDPPQGLSIAAPATTVKAAPSVQEPATTQRFESAPAPAPAPVPASASDETSSTGAEIGWRAPSPTNGRSVTPPPMLMPAQAPTQALARTDESFTTHKVKRGDTLTKIAVATKPEGVTLDQMLVALFKHNESEFDNGNMNRLRTGKILSIPSAEDASAVTSTEARRIVVAQARDFNAYRARLAAAVAAAPAKKDAARQDDQGWIAPKVVEKPLTTEQKQDELKVSTTQASKDAKAQPGLEEELVSRDRALQEERDRTAQLEKNIADLQKLAELQKSEAQRQAEIEKASQDKEESPVEPVVTTTTETTQTDTEGVIPSVQVTTETIQPPPTAKPVIEPSVTESGDEDSDNSLWIYGGIGLGILVLVGYLIARRKADGDAPPTGEFLSDSELMANSVFGATGGQTVDTSASIQTDFSQATLSAAIDGTEEAVDPIMEADLYIALKQETQAEEILVDALKGDPSRLTIYLKLLEIYSGQKNIVKFQKVAKDLKNQTSSAGPEWSRAVAMGRDLDPGNPLYGGGDYAAGASAAVPSRLTEVAEPTVANFGFKPPASSSATALNLDIGVPPVSAPLKMPDIDLSLPEEPVAAASDIPMVTQSVTAAGGPDFDFDLDAPASDSAAVFRESAGDFSRIDLDLADSSSPASAVSAFVPAEAPASADDDATDVSTKLELAQAYEEMGEREGQRELLEEILREGNPQQREFARAKLAALGA